MNTLTHTQEVAHVTPIIPLPKIDKNWAGAAYQEKKKLVMYKNKSKAKSNQRNLFFLYAKNKLIFKNSDSMKMLL